MKDSVLKRTLLVVWNCFWDAWHQLKRNIDPVNNKWLVCHGPEWLSVILDRIYLCRMFKQIFGYDLDLKNPRTFNEKLNWLKLYNRNPLYTTLVDKYKVKEFVAKQIGEEYVIPLLKVYRKAEDINFDELPTQFVLKCNHNSDVIIVRDKTKIDRNNVIQRLSQQLKQGHYFDFREWPYRNVEPVIIAEKYMQDQYGELRDYKFFCFDGKVKALFVATDRQKKEEPWFNFFDSNYNTLPIKNGHPVNPNQPAKPICFEKMKDLAKMLSLGFPHVRVDFYEVNGRVYFGEFTFYHFAGSVPFEPAKWDRIFGDYIDLSLLKKSNS